MTLDKKQEQAITSIPFTDLQKSLSELATMTPDKVALIAERMVEIDRASKTTGRSDTQTTNK